MYETGKTFSLKPRFKKSHIFQELALRLWVAVNAQFQSMIYIPAEKKTLLSLFK